MGLLSRKGVIEFPYHKDDVFEALEEAIHNLKGMKIYMSDKTMGHIFVKTSISLLSWGENVPISVTEVSPGRTRVDITSEPKTAFGIIPTAVFSLGRYRKHVEKILEATSRILSRKIPVKVEVTQRQDVKSPSQRILELKSLLYKGLITPEEFERKKADILSEI